MFCFKCGKADQIPNSYCRGCGEFLNTGGGSKLPAFGGNSPQENARAISILSLIGAVVSLFAAWWMYATHFNFPVALYLGAAFLLCNAFWHFSNFFVGMTLRRGLNAAREELVKKSEELPTSETRPLLTSEDARNFVHESVTENTTRHLDKIER